MILKLYIDEGKCSSGKKIKHREQGEFVPKFLTGFDGLETERDIITFVTRKLECTVMFSLEATSKRAQRLFQSSAGLTLNNGD